jgi:hypothetical protein
MKRKIAVVGVVLASSTALLMAPMAVAEDSWVSATLTPSELTLTPGARASGVLLFTNSGDKNTNVRVRAIGTDSSISAHVAKSVRVPAKSSVALTYTLERRAEGTGQETAVRFVLNWSQGRGTPRASVELVRVKVAAGPAVIEAKFESNVTNINENRPGAAALVVSNPRDEPVRVERLQLTAPDAVDLSLTCPGGGVLGVGAGTSKTFAGCSLTIPPRSQEVLPVNFKTIDRIAPGPRTALVKISARAAGGASQSSVASTSFTVDVFAESDILKAIGVPVFLLLPGVVIVLATWFLIQKLSPWRQVTGDKGLESVVSAATVTAILGLAISLVVALIYPRLTTWFFPGYERDYLRAYGFRDFYYVIAYSFAIAIVIWLLALGGFYLTRWLALPWQNDTPLSLLRKIGIRGLVRGQTAYPRVKVTDTGAGAPPPRGLLLARRTAGKSLIAPTITVGILENGTSDTLAARIEEDVSQRRAFDLWKAVRSAVRDNTATVSYKDGNVTAPRLFDANKVESDGQSAGPIAEVRSGGS